MRLVVFFALVLSGAAHAQVYKCAGPDGKTVYSQAPCPDAGRQLRPGELSGNAAGRVKTQPAIAAGGNLPAGAGANIGAPAATCPSDQDIKNMEADLSVRFPGRGVDAEERQARISAQIKAARDCRAGVRTAAPAAAPRAKESIAAPATTAPGGMASCDPGGCWDFNGRRYTHAAGGNMFRDDGKFCVRAGPNLNCN